MKESLYTQVQISRLEENWVYIDGHFVEGEENELFSYNPADSSINWQGRTASASQCKEAFLAAKKASTTWADLSFEKRANYLKAFANEVEKAKKELCQLISLETGKPLWEALTEVSAVIGKIDLSIKAYQERNFEKETEGPEATLALRYKPHGVVLVLGAFNFPAHLSNGHIVPALLAGNVVLYKPSEYCPLVAKAIMNCWHRANLPQGAIQCLQGDRKVAETLMSEKIKALYFTGSYATGQKIQQFFSGRPEILLALEMGGNNPLVFDKVDNIKAAVYMTILSCFLTAGQRCSAARRLFIPKNTLGESYLDKLLKEAQNLKIGPFSDTPEPFMGPVINELHAKKHLEAQAKLQQLGGESILLMKSLKEKSGFLSPGIIDMTKVKQAPDEEIFAPFIQVYRYNDLDEAIQLANQTEYGLAAGFLSDNLKNYQYFYQRIEAGLINWNRPTTGASSALPFGGIGKSGNQRPSAYFAADYCSYPIASLEQEKLALPEKLLPGIALD